MTADQWSETPLSDSAKAKLELLWDEYKYRHDLCWRVVMQVTAGVVVLASLPYADLAVTNVLAQRILLAPLLGMGLTGFGWFVLKAELSLLDLIRDRFRPLQEQHLQLRHKSKSGFTKRVRNYLRLLVVLQLLNVVVVVMIWIPETGAR